MFSISHYKCQPWSRQAQNTYILTSHLAHSHHSSADDIFDLEFALQNKYSAQENTSEEESEDQTVIENPNPICAPDDPTENTKGQSDEYLDDAVYDPGNVGTIQEAEEYGQQSDSDTTMLIPHRGRMRKKLETDNKEVEDKLTVSDTPLDTVIEENNL